MQSVFVCVRIRYPHTTWMVRDSAMALERAWRAAKRVEKTLLEALALLKETEVARQASRA